MVFTRKWCVIIDVEKWVIQMEKPPKELYRIDYEEVDLRANKLYVLLFVIVLGALVSQNATCLWRYSELGKVTLQFNSYWNRYSKEDEDTKLKAFMKFDGDNGVFRAVSTAGDPRKFIHYVSYSGEAKYSRKGVELSYMPYKFNNQQKGSLHIVTTSDKQIHLGAINVKFWDNSYYLNPFVLGGVIKLNGLKEKHLNKKRKNGYISTRIGNMLTIPVGNIDIEIKGILDHFINQVRIEAYKYDEIYIRELTFYFFTKM